MVFLKASVDPFEKLEVDSFSEDFPPTIFFPSFLFAFRFFRTSPAANCLENVVYVLDWR